MAWVSASRAETLTVVAMFELGGWDPAELVEEPPVVEPVDPLAIGGPPMPLWPTSGDSRRSMSLACRLGAVRALACPVGAADGWVRGARDKVDGCLRPSATGGMGVAVVVTVVITTLITVVVLVMAGWSAGRPELPGKHEDRLGRGGGDPWHGAPQPEVVDRPAGADAEADAAEQARQTSARRPG